MFIQHRWLPAGWLVIAAADGCCYCCCQLPLLQGKRLDIVRSEMVLADLVSDVHCIIEAMIGKGGSVNLHLPQLLGVPEVRRGD